MGEGAPGSSEAIPTSEGKEKEAADLMQKWTDMRDKVERFLLEIGTPLDEYDQFHLFASMPPSIKKRIEEATDIMTEKEIREEDKSR